MPELDNMEPEMDQEPQNDVIGTHGETDREGAMAKADLFKLANYAHKLYQQMNDEDQLEAWVQAKITKAADYIASVYHYLEYEMKFSEYGHHLDNSDTLSEGQKRVLKARLMEAKDKMKELKKTQAEKVKEKKVDEGVMTGGEQECAECGGTGVVHVPGVQPSDRAKELARKHNTSTRAHYAAMKRLQAEENIDEESEGNAFTAHKRAKADNDGDFEDKPSSTGGKISRKGGVTRHKGNTDRFSDEPYDSSNDRTKSHAKARSSADKAGEREMDKAAEKESKAWGKANPGKQTIHKDGKTTTNEAKKAAKDYDGDGKIESGKDEYLGSRIAAAKKAGKLKEGQKCMECGMMMEKCSCMHESAGKTMSRAAKGNEKYGKDGMKALAKAGKEGKSLEPIKAKYNKYDESAKWRDPKYKDKLYTQEPRDEDDYYQSDDDYYNPKPDDYPGAKNLKGGSEYRHNDPLRAGYGRYGVGSLNTHGKRKGMPSRDHITSLKGSIKDAHGKHPHPNLPEAAKPSAGLSKGKNDLSKKKLKEDMSPAELAHHHASEYAKHHKAGNIDLMKHHKDECQKCGGKITHGAMGECYHSHPAIQGGQMYECPMAPVTTMEGKDKPSAGLSKAKKSAVVKDAKAGKDIGKPGKSFDKVAKSAGGGEKGEKIAAAAMWKNMKETVAYIAEKAKATKPDYIDLDKDGDKTEPMKKAAKEKETVKESTDLARMRQLMTRLNG
jgi:hypothetical protein